MQTLALFLTPNIVAELICLVAAVFLLRRDPHPAWRIHRWYLCVVICVECAGVFIDRVREASNHWLYNGFVAIEGLFVSAFLFYLIRQFIPLRRWWLAGWLFIWYGYYSYEIVSTGFRSYLHNSVNMLGIGMVVCCLFYFILRLQHIGREDLLRSAGFWWAYGTFFFYTTGTVIALFYPWFAKPGHQLWGIPLAKVAQYFVNIITYNVWAYSYYLRYRRKITV